ncbi:MAG: CRISPR-associated ring nuclease [Candidatus Scalindua sp.]|nr:CRISPR-associated ring nuclease [Candidatus Scalindua sp.]
MRKRENRVNKNEILIAVSRLNPQVITETLHCLTSIKIPGKRISVIFSITAVSGKKKILKTSITSETGKFSLLCKEYGINPETIWFGTETIISLCGKDGRELIDFRTKKDNRIFEYDMLSQVGRYADKVYGDRLVRAKIEIEKN